MSVVAPHPDDEVFGVGSLMRSLVDHGHRIHVVAVTDGEAAFGERSKPEQAALVQRRIGERARALRVLGVDGSVDIVRLRLPDGAVADHEDELAALLVDVGHGTIVATWRHDGHPDHEATGRAAARAAEATGARLYEYPVWAAHRGRLSRAARRAAHEVAVPEAARAAKLRAVAAFRSQLDPSPDGSPVVPASLISGLRADCEVLLG